MSSGTCTMIDRGGCRIGHLCCWSGQGMPAKPSRSGFTAVCSGWVARSGRATASPFRAGQWVTLVATLLGCAHGDDWRSRASEDRDIRVAIYRHFLAGPDPDGRLRLNCLGVQSESTESASGPIADETPETLAAFRSDPELVGPDSACRMPRPGQLPVSYRGEVIEVGRPITIEYVKRRDEGTAIVGVGVVTCHMLRSTLCDGAGYRLRLTREGDRWLVVGVELAWQT